MTAATAEDAVRNAKQTHSYAQGYCLMFVRDEAWKIGSLYGSAIEAWNGARHKHKGDRSPPLGAPCFYSGGRYGHIVIWVAKGHMRSTDCTVPMDVSDADLDWPVRAWGDTYLGWTEDLNGVLLPLDGGDEMNESDWSKLRGIVADEVAKVWEDKMVVTQPGTGQDTEKKREQVLRETWQKVTKAT
jgi:hypothetical protein